MPKYFVLAFLVLNQTALHILPGDTIHTETIDRNGFDKRCPGLSHSLFPKKKISFDRNGRYMMRTEPGEGSQKLLIYIIIE